MKAYILFVEKNRKLLTLLFIALMVLAVIGVTRININANFDIFSLTDSENQKTLEEMTTLFGDSEQTMLMYENTGDLDTTIAYVSDTLKGLQISHMSPKAIKSYAEALNITELSPIIEKEGVTYILFTLNMESGFDLTTLYDTLDGDYYLSGNTYMQNEVFTLIFTIISRIPPLAMLMILLTFRSQLASFKAAILSVLPAGIAALWTLGLAGWIGGELSIITVLAPIFSIIIGSADGLHFISHMEHHSGDKIEALTHTLKLVGIPMIITTTTSIAGFIGLMLIKTDAIKDLAIFASTGIFLAGVVTWYILPLILTGRMTLKQKDVQEGKMLLNRIWGRKSLVITMILVMVSIAFMPLINIEFNQLMFFKESTNVQKNFSKISEVNGGALPIYFFGEYEEDAPIMDMMSALKASDRVARMINPLQYEGLLQTPAALQFIRYQDNNMYFRALIFPSDQGNETLEELMTITEAYDVKGQLTGIQFVMKEMNDSVISNQLKSLLATMILILTMLKLSLKSTKLTLIATLPIVIMSLSLYGFLGASGIPLNLMTATIFSISLGIGIDYAIHYTSVYKYYADQGDDNPRATALRLTQRPIIANAFGLSLGMTALWLSPLRIHMQISSMMWIAMMTSVFLSLTLVPTLIKKKEQLN